MMLFERLGVKPLALMVLAAVLLAACASTQVTAVWKDPTYQVRPNKILVISVAKNPLNRRLFEDEFAKELKMHGTEAVASYSVLPDKQLSDKQEDNQEAIAAKVKELGVDSILITRLVSKKTVKTYVPTAHYYPQPYYGYWPPASYGYWPDYYGHGYRYMHTPGYIAEDEYAVMETNLYEAKDNKLVWAASGETGIMDASPSLMQGYIEAMVKNMIGLGLLPAK